MYMQLFSDETEDNLRLAWLSLVEALYTFAPWQRVVLVLGIIMIIPAYWIFRVGATSVYGYSYNKKALIATPSFTDAKDLQVGPVVVLPVTGGGYMAYAKVMNPNLKLSATQATYTAKFFSQNGQRAYQTSGQLYVLPGKDTYVVVPRFNSAAPATTGKVEITSVRFQQKYQTPEVSITTPTPTVFPEKEGVRLEGVVINNSPYKLSAVHIVFFLYDANNKVVAVSDRSEFTVQPRERRAYVIHFPGVTQDDFVRAVPIAETNTADVANIQTLDNSLQLQDIKPKR